MRRKFIISLFKSFNSKKVLIVGDAMIDAYMWGEINRDSPEAPVPVVEINKHENRLGGAANVARNIKSLEGEAILCSVIGNDDKGILFKKLMRKENLSTTGIISSKKRKTTVKTRVIANNKHQIRIDEESSQDIKDEKILISKIKSLISSIDIIILQDYNKGVLTKKVIKSVIKIAIDNNIPTIVDPKTKNYDAFKRCTIFKPNLKEMKQGMDIEFDIKNIKEVKSATSTLRTRLNTEGVLLTLSEKGICIQTKEKFSHFPVFTRNIIDVSGAGDTVIAIASLCLTNNINYEYISMIANLAGGLVCEEVGVVPINKKRLLDETLKLFT